MPNFADYIFNRALNIGLAGVYVGIVNNNTTTPYKTGPSGSDGLITFSNNPPAGLYTVYTSPTGSGNPPGGDWVATGETSYVVAPASPVANTDLAGPLLNAIAAGSNLSVGAPPGGVGAQSVALINNPTFTGLVTAQAGLTLTGLLTILDAVGRIVPGATSLSLRNNANNADNLLLTDAGLATLRNALTILAGGATVTGVVSGSLGFNDGRGIAGANLPVKLGEFVLGSASASVTFSSISQAFRHLMILCQSRGDAAANAINILLQFNGDTGGNYIWSVDQDLNTTVSGNTQAGQTSILALAAVADSGPANYAGVGTIFIPNYSGSIFYKAATGVESLQNGSGAAGGQVSSRGGNWANTAAITSLVLSASSGNFKIGSVFSLYGY